MPLLEKSQKTVLSMKGTGVRFRMKRATATRKGQVNLSPLIITLSVFKEDQIMKVNALFCSAVLAFICPSLSTQGQEPSLSVETVALSGQQIPGASSGVGFSSFVFSLPSLNESGQVAFNIAPNRENSSIIGGLFRSEPSGELTTVIFAEDQVPGVDAGLTLGDISAPTLNNAGQTSFSGQVLGLTDGLEFDDFFITLSEGSGNGLDRLLSVGMTFQGGTIASRGRSAFNDAGQSAAFVNFDLFGGSPSDVAILLGRPGSLGLVVQTGDQAPNSSATFAELTSPVLSNSGQVAFTAELDGTGVSAANNEAVYRGGAGTLAPVAREGDPAPGAGSGVVFGDFAFGTVGLNNADQVAFRADLRGTGVDDTNDSAIFSEGSGALTLVARTGEQAADLASGVVFSIFRNPTINHSGQTTFLAFLSGSGVNTDNDCAIFSGDSTTLDLIARSGDLVPGADSAVFDRLTAPGTNALGQVAFTAFLDGPNVSSLNGNTRGIYATNLDGQLNKVARTGDTIEVNGELRTIRSLSFQPGTGNEDGEASGFNDEGQLVFSAAFTDDSSGIFIADTNPPTFMLGDVNLDGAIDFLDIAPFITLLTTSAFQFEADVNGDGTVSFLDISPFISLLTQQ